MDIGKKIKELRKAQNLSQEKFAEFFDITPQAVSKWESGTTYPDITIIPSIANYFNVTIDELFNMDDIRNKEKINSIFASAHRLIDEDNIEEAVLLLKNSVKIYPNNYSLISELALALTLTNNDDAYMEAIELSERVLANSTNEKVRSTTRANLCLLYLKTGSQEKTAALLKTLPHVWECREFLSVCAADINERNNVIKKSINTILNVIYSMINGNIGNDSFALGFNAQNDNIGSILDKIKIFFNNSRPDDTIYM